MKKYSGVRINNIIRAEIGRNIYGSFFSFKTIIETVISRLKKTNVKNSEFHSIINQEIQNKFGHHQQNEEHRVQTIFNFLRDKMDTALSGIQIKNDSDLTSIRIHQVKAGLLVLENELLEFQAILNGWNCDDSFPCIQSKWRMDAGNPSTGAILSINKSCAKKSCPNRESILRNILKINSIFIQDFLQRAHVITERLNIEMDEKLYKSLVKLDEIFAKRSRKLDILKYCWNIADLLISLLVDNQSKIYTKNVNHFLVLLELRGLENQILPFNS
ncbi:MAG TPA: hypothetical protein VKM55_00645 [Candidatus Lokiarchaeia archaeon]|nr:hypothetical protein [Candidatus Lokiarchaeia archaeon]